MQHGNSETSGKWTRTKNRYPMSTRALQLRPWSPLRPKINQWAMVGARVAEVGAWQDGETKDDWQCWRSQEEGGTMAIIKGATMQRAGSTYLSETNQAPTS